MRIAGKSIPRSTSQGNIAKHLEFTSGARQREPRRAALMSSRLSIPGTPAERSAAAQAAQFVGGNLAAFKLNRGED